ncbi:hypothetical protein [Roseibium sediminis]|uniref:hypothetical protein n=1 Tax=Roseibium sediminis TaxID=1775174 RepID=UPI00123CD741|nr:hypothetical protein [Roseibium sediminis]
MTKKGILSIHMDGRWDIEDMLDLADALKDTYAYFYSVQNAGNPENEHLERLLADHFWQGNMPLWKLESRLYDSIPSADALKIRTIKYASPGFMDIAGILGVLLLLAKVANAWLDVGSKLVDTYQKIEEFFSRRRHLQKAQKNFELNSEAVQDIDTARELMFELGDALGYNSEDCEKILNMLNNPIAGLKFMVALAKETRKISELSQKGLLSLPTPPIESVNDPE